MMSTFRSLNFIARHPLNRGEPLRAIGRALAWQIATRLSPHAVAVPFVDDTRLLVAPGMTGATGNVYCGLHEFEDMVFVLHALRADELFIDVGANIGSYTVLAAGVVGARAVAFEPVPRTYSALCDNLRLNNLASLVDARNEGVGAESGRLAFTSDLDAGNHVVTQAERGSASLEVPITTLDAALEISTPCIIKLDVEGFESAVVAGAERTLRSPLIMALLMELNGSGYRYGFDEQRLHDRMLEFGFTPAIYDPLTRKLRARDFRPGGDGKVFNVLYVRDPDALQLRLSAAPRRAVHGTSI